MTSGHWASSTRAARLPKNWPTLTQQVKERDQGRCRTCGTVTATKTRGRWTGGQVDHVKHGDNHQLTNLQLLCRPCHTAKTQAEANAARHAHPRQRPQEAHPGLRTSPRPQGGAPLTDGRRNRAG